ncbi:L,D-transpeptidase family protein [Ahrensia kielensis]|uniref:L,D-transpeptidase family protein n=1 Tax=Ahrensia kielensis TaxID=76980 RepID=UPI00036FDF56|nr:murein L,D-transpeptidase family protein [Ahrensia kielensis]
MNLRRFSIALGLASALALAGCNSSDVLDVARKANQPLPQDVVRKMKAQGMTKSSPVMMRIFKEEGVLEVWKQKDTGRYGLVKSYEICKYSGVKGPKIKEGDRQAPEGFYMVNRGLMNPNSDYYLSFNLGYPNRFDRSLGRTGSNLMVHGDCSSAGCYAMTDENVAEIYGFARDALAGGQEAFQVQAFPFRMTAENMVKHRDSEHFEYWSMLKKGYDHFELTQLPPKVDVCNRRYVFNQSAVEGSFNASAACPKMEMPYKLEVAYTKFENNYAVEFEKLLAKHEGRKPGPVSLKPLPTPPAPVAMPVEKLPEEAAVAPANVIATASSSGAAATTAETTLVESSVQEVSN